MNHIETLKKLKNYLSQSLEVAEDHAARAKNLIASQSFLSYANELVLKIKEEIEALTAAVAALESKPKCATCKYWRQARTQGIGAHAEMMCGRSLSMGMGLYGQDGKAVITSSEFGCVYYEREAISAAMSATEGELECTTKD